jgi:hypothetical protein
MVIYVTVKMLQLCLQVGFKVCRGKVALDAGASGTRVKL